MGIALSKCYTKHESSKELRAKIHVLEEEIREIRHVRDREARAYEQHVVLFACQEEEWKAERRKHKEEAARLRRRLGEEEERVRSLEEEVAASRGDKEQRWVSTDYLLEHMKVEQARREEAVEKWKQLYHAIKTELDDLIHRTRQGQRDCWEAEQGLSEGLRMELRAKEETLEALRSRIAAMEKDAVKKEREIDILRQSLRILSSTKRNRTRKNAPRSVRSRMI